MLPNFKVMFKFLGCHIGVKRFSHLSDFFFPHDGRFWVSFFFSQIIITRPHDVWCQVSRQILKALWQSFPMTPCMWASNVMGWSCGLVSKNGLVQPCAKKFKLLQLRKVWSQCVSAFSNASFKRHFDVLQGHVQIFGLSHWCEKISTFEWIFFSLMMGHSGFQFCFSQIIITQPHDVWCQVSRQILKALWQSFWMTPCMWASNVMGWSCGLVSENGPVQPWSSPARMTKLHWQRTPWPEWTIRFDAHHLADLLVSFWGKKVPQVHHISVKSCTPSTAPHFGKIGGSAADPQNPVWDPIWTPLGFTCFLERSGTLVGSQGQS